MLQQLTCSVTATDDDCGHVKVGVDDSVTAVDEDVNTPLDTDVFPSLANIGRGGAPAAATDDVELVQFPPKSNTCIARSF